MQPKALRMRSTEPNSNRPATLPPHSLHSPQVAHPGQAGRHENTFILISWVPAAQRAAQSGKRTKVGSGERAPAMPLLVTQHQQLAAVVVGGWGRGWGRLYRIRPLGTGLWAFVSNPPAAQRAVFPAPHTPLDLKHTPRPTTDRPQVTYDACRAPASDRVVGEVANLCNQPRLDPSNLALAALLRLLQGRRGVLSYATPGNGTGQSWRRRRPRHVRALRGPRGCVQRRLRLAPGGEFERGVSRM